MLIDWGTVHLANEMNTQKKNDDMMPLPSTSSPLWNKWQENIHKWLWHSDINTNRSADNIPSELKNNNVFSLAWGEGQISWR